MGENPNENPIKYPQRIRGGAGFFPEEGKAILEGQFGARLEVGGSTDPNGNPATGLVLREGELSLSWKRAGSINHPLPEAATLEDANYRQIGSEEVGFDTTIEWTLAIVDPSKLGVGPNGKGWYFAPNLDILKPDFDNGSAQSTGTMQIWVNDGHIDLVGGCKWSRNVGSGIDGILLNIDGGSQPVSESYPRLWPKGTKIRVKINYWVPPK